MKRLDLHRLLAMLLSIVMLLNMNYAVLAEEVLVPSPGAEDIDPTPDTGSCEHVIDCMGVCAACGQVGFDPTESHAWELNGFDEVVHNWLCSSCGGTTTGMHYTYCDAEAEGCHTCGWTGAVNDIFHYSTQETHAYDDVQHWFACTKCDGKWMPEDHAIDAGTGACTVCDYAGEACTHDEINCVGACINCGATGFTPVDRHTWPDYFNCSNNAEHWRTCRDCGVEAVREKHYYSCEAETIACAGCNRSDVAFDHVSHSDANWWKTYSWDETQHWFDCDSCDEMISPDAHFVSCVTGACTICGATGVESEDRSHSIDSSVYEHDADSHWNPCAGCDERVNEQEHLVDCATGNCTVCGAEGVNGSVVHVYDMENYCHDDTAHWRACKNCGSKSYNGRHTYYCVTGACEICGQADVTFNAFYHEGLDSSTYVYDETQHWYDCTGCDEKVNAKAHTIKCATDTCTVCGAVGAESENRLHNWNYEAYGYDADQHWYICTGCDAGTEKAAHEIDCVTGACKICGMVNGKGEKQHVFDASAYQHDETTHWQVCTACGGKINVAEHTGSCQDETDCVVCGAEGIVSEKSDHHWNEWQAGDMIHWSTCKLCGIESSDEHSAPCNTDGTCQVCGAKDMPWLRWEHGNINYNEYGADSYIHGFVCDREGCSYLVDEDLHTVKCSNPKVCIVCGYENVANGVFMEHDYGEWQYDNETHWRECACGEQHKSNHFASCLSDDACHECGAKDVIFEFSGHVATEKWGTTAVGHYGMCTFCGQQIGELEPHYDYCGNLAEHCYACGLMRTSANGITLEIRHSMSGGYQYDEISHWYECRSCGEKTEEPHEISCTSGGCSICGAADVQGEVTHFRWGTYEYDAENHWFVCLDCGEKFELEAHEPDSKGECICGAADLITATPTPEPTAVPTPTAEPTAVPTATPTAEPTVVPPATPTVEPTAEPTAAPTAEPTAAPTAAPTAVPTATPTAEPTVVPPATPTAAPTTEPTVEPTAAPTAEPTVEPTAAPTAEPTVKPTVAPTAEPTVEPTAVPTAEPTVKPTVAPTAEPTAEPTVAPTAEPTMEPTAAPTTEPTVEPTAVPTTEPTVEPTVVPTAEPTVEPTVVPTAEPTAEPTAAPTAEPTAIPTVVPTVEPTAEPTATPTPAPVPVIVPEKVENKEIEVLEQEISKVVDNIIAEIQAAVKAETEAAVEGESEEGAEDTAESEPEVEIVVKVEVPVEPLKEAVGEETYEQIVQMPVHEKIVVLLSVLDNSEGQSKLLKDTGMAISEESKAIVETVIQSVGALDEESTAVFQQMLEESFPKQEVKIDDNELVYYLIPMYITTNDVTQVKYYAFCLDKQTGKWMFTIVEEGMDVVEAIEQAQQNAADEAAE